MSEVVLSQRELRNQSSDVLRRVAAGDTFTVTNNGIPVARLVPAGTRTATLPISKPATRRGGWSGLVGERRANVDVILDELREDRL